MSRWGKTFSKTHNKPYWFKSGEKSTWYDPTDLNGTLERLKSESSSTNAATAIVKFIPADFIPIINWIFEQSKIRLPFSAEMFARLLRSNGNGGNLKQMFLNHFQPFIDADMVEDKSDYPALRFFGLLKEFDQDINRILDVLLVPYLSTDLEGASLFCSRRLISLLPTHGMHTLRVAVLLQILVRNTKASSPARAALTDFSYQLHISSEKFSENYQCLDFNSSNQSNLNLSWMFSSVPTCSVHAGAHTVVVLLGAPGVGKSVLGRFLKTSNKIASYLDVGFELSKLGFLQKAQTMFTMENLNLKSEIAKHLLNVTLVAYMQSEGKLPLVVTFVKDPEDAYILLEMVRNVARTHDIQNFRVQGVYLRKNFVNTHEATFNAIERRRTSKWEANNFGILEVFASQNCLFELTNIGTSSSRKWTFKRQFPVFSYYPLCISIEERHDVVAQVKQLLGVDRIEFMQPSSFLRTEMQCRWVSFPGSYQVSHKIKGTRYWLIFLRHGLHCWLLNRAGSIYIVDKAIFATDQALIELEFSVLDGMLLTESDSKNVFVAFDVLCFNGRRTWSLPLEKRLCCFAGLPQMTQTTAMASEENCVYVQRITSLNNCCDSVAELMDARTRFVGAVDGLIFTPTTPYVFGVSHLVFKWQDIHDFKVDMASSLFHSSLDIKSHASKKVRVLPPTSITSSTSKSLSISDVTEYSPGFHYKCVWRNDCWTIDSVRLDAINADENEYDLFREIVFAIEYRKAMWDAPMLLNVMRLQETLHIQTESSALDADVQSIAMDIDSAMTFIDPPASTKSKQHPARQCISFSALYSTAMELVQCRQIEQCVDAETGLEIFSYIIQDSVDAKNEYKKVVDVNMFRGLILHPLSETIVATPFVRFFKTKVTDIKCRSNRVVRASVKYDGSLIIAFKWNGELYTSTRRRMNSEQALVARRLLRQSDRVQSEFKEGWTYLLELIGGDNIHVSPYPMSLCLVLLTALNSDGIEVDVADRMEMAERADLLYPPTICGYIDDIAKTVLHGRYAVHEMPWYSEGWVVEDPVDGARFKMIHSSWETASIAVKSLVHPCVVWHALLMCNFSSLQTNVELPPHAKAEISLMADAIVRNAMLPIRDLVMEYRFEDETLSPTVAPTEVPTIFPIVDPTADTGSEESISSMNIKMSGDDLHECDSESFHVLLINAAKKKDAVAVVSLLSLAVRLGVIVNVKEVVRNCIPILEWNCTFTYSRTSVLRLLLLHSAIPALSSRSMLDGYSPSPWLAQTFAKGWPLTNKDMKKLVSWSENMDAPIQFVFAILSVEIFRYLFAANDVKVTSTDLSRIGLCKTLCSVCRLWRDRVIHEYSSEIPKWKQVMETLRCEKMEAMRCEKMEAMRCENMEAMRCENMMERNRSYVHCSGSLDENDSDPNWSYYV